MGFSLSSASWTKRAPPLVPPLALVGLVMSGKAEHVPSSRHHSHTGWKAFLCALLLLNRAYPLAGAVSVEAI